MEEYQDCLKRARRLAVACEATLTGSDSAMSVVTMEDLLIYTRWLICMLHSVKAIHALIRVSIQLCFKFGRLGQYLLWISKVIWFGATFSFGAAFSFGQEIDLLFLVVSQGPNLM